MSDADKPDRNAAVVAVVMARYLATKDPSFAAFLKASLASAAAAGISASDLSMLQTIIGSVG